MMKNKHISKITMLTCLMLGGIVNAQEFYTCVPKKSWWNDVLTESVAKGIAREKCLKCEVKNEGIRNCFKGCYDRCVKPSEGESSKPTPTICSRECKKQCGSPSNCGTCP